MKIVFFGSGHFAVAAFKALIKSQHEVVCVVTQPDKKKGRHLRVTGTEIKNIAQEAGLKIFQPQNINDAQSVDFLKSLNADVFVIVAYGQLLSREVLDIPAIMPLNIHASLLPRYRGAAPVNWALINADKKTGVSIIHVVLKMDCGPLIARQEIRIEEADTAPALEDKLSEQAAPLLIKTLEGIQNRDYRLEEQDEQDAVYAPKLKKEMGSIDWDVPAQNINSQIKGLLPWPGAFTRLRRKNLKIFRAHVLPIFPSRRPMAGEVVRADKHGIVVACGRGFLEIEELQLEAGKRMSAESFVIGHKISPGDILGSK